MVRITTWEIKIFVAMLIAISSMTMIMYQTGLSDVDPDNNEPPDINISTGLIKVAGEMPPPPTGSDAGYLIYDQSVQDTNLSYTRNQVWLNGSNDPPATGTELLLLPPAQDGSPAVVEMTVWEDGNITETDQAPIYAGEIVNGTVKPHTTGLSVGEWEVGFQTQKYDEEYVGTGELYIRTKYTIHDQPGSATFLDNVFDATVGTGVDVARGVFWIGTVIVWFAVFLVELAVNVAAIPVQFGLDVVNLYSWMVESIGGLFRADAPIFVRLILFTPAAVMGFIAVHFLLMLVDIIWIG